MIVRKITQSIDEWVTSSTSHPLIIEGARQVGKTYAIQNYIRDNFSDSCVEINFIQRPDLCAIFNDDISPEGLSFKLKQLFPTLFQGNKKKILFLDEIQQCPNAIVALKSFSLLNQFHVIASGSLLGVSYQKVASFPVGYVKRITMYPLDFSEFVEAVGKMDLYQSVTKLYKDNKIIPEVLHQSMMRVYRDYIVVGGMPEVVTTYLTTNDFNAVFEVQQRIVQDYQSDIAKYASSSERVKAREVFDSLPAQLGKENKKFQYKQIRSGARSAMYDGSIQWLIDAGIVYRCHNLSTLELPLISYRMPNHFKVYLMDTGLLISMFGKESQQRILLNDLGIAKGGLYENIIALELIHLQRPLYYFDRRSTLEIDFIDIYQNEIIAIEVKSGENTRSRSLKTLLDEGEITQGLRVFSKKCSKNDNIESIPFYLFSFKLR